MTGPRVDAIGDRYDVVVVGGGPAGLTAGVTAARAGASVAVLDARRLGGRSAVDRVGDADAIVFNRGPHAFYQEGAAASILMSLGIRPTGGTAPVRGSWLYHDDGEFVVMPTGPTALVRTQALSIASKVRAGALLAGIGRIDAAALSGRTAAEWIDERSGGSASAAAVLASIVRVATYASDLDTLSADVAVSQVALAVKSGVRYLDGGFQQIVDRLDAAGRSAGMTVRTATPVTSIRQTGTGWIVEADGRRIEAGSIVLAAGGPEMARRLLGGDPGWGTLGPDVTAACLELAVRVEPSRRFALGLDSPLYLSTHCPPADLAPPGIRVVHVMRYGSTSSDADRAALTTLARRAGISAGDVVEERFLHRMVVAHAQATVDRGGLIGRPPVTVPNREGAFVAGDWVGPIGHLCDASIASGADAGARAATHARTRAAAVMSR